MIINFHNTNLLIINIFIITWHHTVHASNGTAKPVYNNLWFYNPSAN